MSHPDEGTIHAWLDGALPVDEAASLEAHVAACGDCQAAVAEARGLIAASSRILGALDSVPANVEPKTERVSPLLERLRAAPVRTAASVKPVKRWPLQVWGVAATVAIMTGVGIVMRNTTRVPDTMAVTTPSVSAQNAVAAEPAPGGFASTAPAAPASAAPLADKPADRQDDARQRVARMTAGPGVARELDALGAAKDARGNAIAAAPSPPSALSDPLRAKSAPVAAGAGAAANEPASAAPRQLSEKAKESGDLAKRSEGVASGLAVTPAEKKQIGELRAGDKTQDAVSQSGRAVMKAAAPMPAAGSAAAASCARIALGNWRSTSLSVAHGVAEVTARPGPVENAQATVTLDYADGPRTEIGAWLLEPDKARLTVRDAHDETILRLVLSRSTGAGTALLTTVKDNAMATATARLVAEGCAVQKPE